MVHFYSLLLIFFHANRLDETRGFPQRGLCLTRKKVKLVVSLPDLGRNFQIFQDAWTFLRNVEVVGDNQWTCVWKTFRSSQPSPPSSWEDLSILSDRDVSFLLKERKAVRRKINLKKNQADLMKVTRYIKKKKKKSRVWFPDFILKYIRLMGHHRPHAKTRDPLLTHTHTYMWTQYHGDEERKTFCFYASKEEAHYST